MRVMIKYWAIILLCMIIGLAACGGGGGDGGGGESTEYEVTGPTTLTAGAEGTYELAGIDRTSNHIWWVMGNGVLTSNPIMRSVTVQAGSISGGGEFSVHCNSQLESTPRIATPLTVTVVGTTRFRVVLNTPNNLTPATIDGRGAITMTSDNAQANSWSLYFVGDTSGLPKQVPVTITTTNGANLKQLWLDGGAQTQTLLFPRAGGGSVGSGGSVLSIEARPAMIGDGLGETATVTLKAKGVTTMVITVKDK